MKKQLTLVLSLILCGGSLFAQPKGASEPELLVKSPSGLMAPVWSPDGKQLAMTTDNYTGIVVVNADGSNLRHVTNAPGAGYKMVWSADCSQILGRTNIFEGDRVFHELKTWNVNSGKAELIAAKSRNLTAIPTWKQVKIAKGLKTAKVETVYDVMINHPAEATKMIVALNSYAGKMVINPAVSPDGQKIAFQIAGKGCFVCNLDGSNVISLGAGSRPAWLPDSKNVILSEVKDNGNVYTSADLYNVNIATGKRVILTANTDMITLSPAVSPDGKKVAFENPVDAGIYVINLKY